MSGDQLAGLTASLLCLVLVGSSLVARRLEGPALLRLGLIWAAIILGLVALIRLTGVG